MVLTTDGRFGGYRFSLLKGKPVFVYNFVDIERFCREGSEALAPRKHTVVFDFKSAGPGFGSSGS